MKSNAINQVLEGIVGTLANDQLGYPQALTPWLRGMKECINFNGRFIEDDHVLGVAVGVTEATNGTTVKASESWVYGMLATSIDVQANVAILSNVGTFNPGTTALDYHGVVYLQTAAAGTPVAGGLVWYPHEYFDVGVYAHGVQHVDYNGAVVAATMNVWVPYRNQ